MTTTEQGDAPAPTTRPERRSRNRPPWWLVALAVACLAMAAYALPPYLPPDMQTSRIPARSELHVWLLSLHVVTASIAILTGPLQFWPRFRNRHRRIHRWTGRVYFFVGVFPSAMVAVPVAALAQVGASLQLAIVALDALWIVTAVKGLRATRQRRYAEHRAWMIRNFALTTSIITTRLLIPVVLVLALPQLETVAYAGDGAALVHDMASGSTWMALLIHVLYAEWYLQRRSRRPAMSAP